VSSELGFCGDLELEQQKEREEPILRGRSEDLTDRPRRSSNSSLGSNLVREKLLWKTIIEVEKK